MLAGGTTEMIWHFAGYLRLVENEAHSDAKFEAFDHQAITGESHEVLGHFEQPLPTLEEIASAGQRFRLPGSADAQVKPIALQRPDMEDVAFNKAAFVPLTPAPKLLLPVVGGEGSEAGHATAGRVGSGSAVPPYEITIEEGGSSKFVSIGQSNTMDDDDLMLAAPGTGVEDLQQTNVLEALGSMLRLAVETIPDDLAAGFEGNAPTWLEMIVTRDAARAESASESDAQPPAVEPGIYLNGERVESAPDREASIAPVAPESGEIGDQTLTTGGNEAFNGAVIGDINDSAATLVVLGDFYETNGIVQVNVIGDHDDISAAGPGTSDVASGGNRADNLASIIAEELSGPKGAGISRQGLDVRVEVVEGDVYDVKALTQRNWIRDNDVAVQTTYEAYAQAHLGGNQQANATTIADWGSYDIIIVMGDYHSANLIFQANVILDDDVLKIAAGGDGTGGQTASTGANSAFNEASITNYSAGGFADVSQSLNDLIAMLARGEEPGLNDWAGFAGSASGSLDVLLVKGNYWDINVISQINVIADMDTAIQYLHPGGGEQWSATGGNAAHNYAAILDAGGLYDQYLGGEHYSDSLLIQANYVDADATLVNGDTQALVSEAVAFTGVFDQDEAPEPQIWTKSALAHDDMMGTVLS